jgi:glycosyltransferase involved in cell wall biosynthesis
MRSRDPHSRLASPPAITAVVSTYNRSALLRLTLESLARQTLPQSEFEVVIVDDGSSDDTRLVVESFTERLPLVYAYQRNAGLASARTHGVYLSAGSILLFLDDDDVTDRALLEQHLATHRRYPDDNYAVLGYTPLDPSIADDPLMHFVTEVGCFLFAYSYFSDGDVLDFEHWWGGRSSCKRAFLIEHGVFNPVFRFGCEDIELAWRLSKHDFRIVYNAKAITTMSRKIDFDGFCNRLIRQGRSNYVFSRLHPAPEVQRWTEVDVFEERWREAAPVYEATLRSARHLDRMATLKRRFGFSLEEAETALLHRAYFAAFRAAKMRGISEGRNQS